MENVADSSNTIANCTSNYSPITSGCFNRAAATNIIIGPNSAYGNSITPSVGNRTGSQAYSDLQAWLAPVKSNSWTNILCLLFPDASPQGSVYKALMQANARSNGITLVDMTTRVAYKRLPYMNSDGHPAFFTICDR